MMRIRHIILALTLFFIAGNLFSQNVVTGVVTDGNSEQPLPYVRVTAKILDLGKELILDPVFTDDKGKYTLNIPKDNCTLYYEFMGFSKETRVITFLPKKRTITQNVKIYSTAMVLDPAQISTTKYEKDVEKSTSSIANVKPKQLETRNIVNASEAVNTAGGIAVVDNEPQIRGGSGFSSGMGSRVMILLDDMPLLRPDAGRPMWNFIPMEGIEQIDIMKGAASVVFGSSALTGAINVLTAYPRSNPTTKVNAHFSIYDKPKNVNETSWNGRNPVKYGVSFLHSRIIKNNFDFVIGGEFFNDEGYIGPEEKVDETRAKNGSTSGKYEMRARLNFATRYRFKKVNGLSVSLNGNFMYTQNAQSFFWNDGFDNKYRSYKGSLSYFKDFTFYVDPTVKYISPRGFVHSFNNRVIFSDNAEVSGAQSARSVLVYDEYQLNKGFNKVGGNEKVDMSIVAGVINQYTNSNGAVFNGIKGSNKPASISSDNISVYGQWEGKFLNKKNLTLQFGARWEFYKMYGSAIDAQKWENKPVFRGGINYQIPKSKTSFRASIGQGFRFPTIGEKYIAISVGQYGFYPNTQLKSESSWNAEIGIMQPFIIDSSFRGMFDIAGYNQEFKDFIEFSCGLWGTTGGLLDKLGFMYLNTGPARISGVDITFGGEGKIGSKVTYNIMLTYTYSNPVTKNRHGVFFTHPTSGEEYTFVTQSTDTTRNVLKYRIEHMFKGDVEFTFCKTISIGLSVTYLSAMKNVDNIFMDYDGANPEHTEYRNATLASLNLPFYGYYQAFEQMKKGTVVLDARISAKIKNCTLSFVVKNLLNKSYFIRPMYMESPRTFNFQFSYDLH